MTDYIEIYRSTSQDAKGKDIPKKGKRSFIYSLNGKKSAVNDVEEKDLNTELELILEKSSAEQIKIRTLEIKTMSQKIISAVSNTDLDQTKKYLERKFPDKIFTRVGAYKFDSNKISKKKK